MSAEPPVAPRAEHIRRVHGTELADPYLWMRNRDDPRFVEYLLDERRHYDARTRHLADLTALLDVETRARTAGGQPMPAWRIGEYEYFERTPGDAEFPVLYRRRPGADDAAAVLVGDEVAAGSGFLNLGVREPSPDGRLLAYSVDLVGDEVHELRFRDLESGVDIADRVAHTYYGAAWSSDSSSFYYVVHDAIYRPYQVRRHAIGTDPADDPVLFEDPDARFHVQLYASGDWIVISSESCDTVEQWLVPAGDPAARGALVRARRPGIEYRVRDLGGGELAVLTNDGAAEYRVLAWGPSGEWDRERELVAGDPTRRIRSVRVQDGRLVLTCRSQGAPFVRVVEADGAVRDHHPLVPGGLVEVLDRPTVVAAEALTMPPRRWDPDEDAPDPVPSRYATEVVWAKAEDGERVPITLAFDPELRRDGGNPCLMRVYGAYERCSDGRFSPALPSLLDRGVVCAIAHVRGGGEMGRRWWLDGRLGAKHHTFSDTVAVRDHLVAAGIAAPGGVVLRGLSAGGLVTGSVYTTHPERWAGVIAEAPAVDLLTQMLDPEVPLTVNEYDEWGDPRDPEQFGWMRAYSPYEILSDRPRPPLLVTAILRDPRVAAYEPAKWVAALRALDSHGNSVLLRAELGGVSHRGPAGRTASASYEAEIQAWVLEVLGLALG